VQQLLGNRPRAEIILTQSSREAWQHVPTNNLLDYIDGSKTNYPAMIASVTFAQLGLLLALYGGGKLAAAWPRSESVKESVNSWQLPACVVRGASFDEPAWHIILGFAGWKELVACSVASRGLCIEAREATHWSRLYLHYFSLDVPPELSPSRIGPLFFQELCRVRLCRKCGKTYQLHSGSGLAPVCRVHPGVCQQVHFYPALWKFSCCGARPEAEGCRLVGTHTEDVDSC